MRHLVALILTAGLFFGAGSATAQTPQEEERDRGLLTSLIEDNLSGAGRTVTVLGFRGALSSRATVETLTIADAEGIWLRAEGLVLDWDRAALFGGRIEINELGAQTIELLRAPVTEESLPDPEAQPFALPDLPVAINVGRIEAGRLFLGAPLLGEDMTLAIDGTLRLAGGEGAADIAATRTDREGIFSVEASYSNATGFLALDLDLSEPADGAVARILGLPGRPSVDLTLTGEGEIADFEARLSLATDGAERATGTFGFISETNADGGERLDLRADIRGDVGALLPPDYAEFFGPESRLAVQARRNEAGEVDLPVLTVRTKSLSLDGSALIDPRGWPRRIALSGLVASEDGDPVLLPLAGERTLVDRGTIEVAFDEETGNVWRGDFVLEGLDRPGLSISELTLGGSGEIAASTDDAAGRFDGALDYAALGLALDDAGLALALGPEITGKLRIARDGNGPVRIEDLTVAGPGIAARAEARIEGLGAELTTASTIRLEAGDLSRFAVLSGLDGLQGGASLGIVSEIEPLNGIFDIRLSGATEDLALGIAEIDPLLAGEGQLVLAADRDETGTSISALRIAADGAEIVGRADITREATDAFVQFDLSDLGVVVDGLTGPARIRAVAERQPGAATSVVLRLEAQGIEGAGSALIAPLSEGGGITGSADLDIAEVGPLAALAGQDITGGARISLSGTAASDFETFDVALDGSATDLDPGIARLTPLLSGVVRLDAEAGRDEAGWLNLDRLSITGNRIAAEASGRLLPSGRTTAQFDARLPDLGVIDLRLSGEGTARGQVTFDPEGQSALITSLTGPGGLSLLLEAVRDTPRTPFEADLILEAISIAPYSALAGRSIGGQIAVDASGLFDPDGLQFDLGLEARTDGLRTGVTEADRVLAGAGTLRVDVARNGDGTFRLTDLQLSYPNLTATADLRANGNTGEARYSARLADVGLFTDDLSGPVTAEGTAALRDGGIWEVAADLAGPGGIGARIAGTVDGARLGLTARGQAPLGLANRYIEPRRLQGMADFDIAINGPAAITSVSGGVTTRDARLAAPALGSAIEDVTARLDLRAGQAEIDLSGRLAQGGTVAIEGSVGITGARIADLTLDLADVVVIDPRLYRSEVDARISVTGPITSGGLVSGRIDVGTTELRVPSSSIGVLGGLPVVRHVGASAEIRQTLNRAGLDETGQEPAQGNGGNGVNLALDLLVNAPNQIFVRGRGLDAELGGQLRIGGTTARPIPSGQLTLVRGRLDVLQQRFVLDEAAITLGGDFIPNLRVLATTEARDGTLVTILLDGPADNPEVSFRSSPDLPQDEVLARLIFGRNLTEITPLQAVQLASAAATLAGRGGGGLVGDLRETLGLNDLDVVSDDNGGVAVRAGAYIGENVYTDVTVGAERTEVDLNLDLTDDITVSAGANSDGETSLGIFYERDY